MAIQDFYIRPGLLGTGLGQAIGQRRMLNQQQDEQAQKEAQQAEQQAMMQDLQRRAFAGDQEAINQLAGFNMQGAISAQNRVGQLGAEQDKVKKRKTAEYIAKGFTLPEEQRAAYFEAGITNPELDIDEEDVPFFGDARIAEAAVRQYAPDLADTVFAKPEEPKAIKTTTIQTPTGARVVNTQTGDTVNEIVDPAKKQEFELKQKERKQKIEQNKRQEEQRIKKEKIAAQDLTDSRKNAVDTSARAFQLTSELGNEDVIAPVTGRWDRMTPTLSGENQDIINKALELKDLLTLDNLKLMQGPLTDNDIKILARAGSGLNVDEDGFLGSEKGVVNQINKVQKMLDQKLKKAVERGDLSQQDYENIVNPQPQEEAGFSSLWGG